MGERRPCEVRPRQRRAQPIKQPLEVDRQLCRRPRPRRREHRHDSSIARHAREHPRVLPVVSVEPRQPLPAALAACSRYIGEIGHWVAPGPGRRAGREHRLVVGKVAIDGQALHPRPLGDGADRRGLRPELLMERHGRLHDPRPRLVARLRPPGHAIGAIRHLNKHRCDRIHRQGGADGITGDTM